MQEAIYAWRRNGGMRWPRYERSDAIMDLRATLRTLNFVQQSALPLPLSRLPSRSVLGSLTTAHSAHDHTHPPVGRVTARAKPGSQFTPHLVSTPSARAIDHRLRERSEWGPSFGLRPQLGGKMPLSCTHCLSFRRALTGTPLAASQTGAQRDSAYHTVCGTVTGCVLVSWFGWQPEITQCKLDLFRRSAAQGGVKSDQAKAGCSRGHRA